MKYTLLMFAIYSINVHATIFQPEVHCENKKQSAKCLISNNSTKAMKCEFLVVGETIRGELITSVKNEIVLPFKKQELLIAVKNFELDRLSFVNGEAFCQQL